MQSCKKVMQIWYLLASAFIANPDLVERFINNLPLSASDRNTYYSGRRMDTSLILKRYILNFKALLSKEYKEILL
ncbi:hypothetical protein [Chryseobacterium wanjuense]